VLATGIAMGAVGFIDWLDVNLPTIKDSVSILFGLTPPTQATQ
jgi:hypothetical protein